MKSLGIELKELTDFRLVYEDLDGDGNPEALFTIEVISDVFLVVLKSKGTQWYRLASPPEFSCWCKYENSPLDSFAEVRGWFYRKDEPTKLLLVRGSSGGTGLYTRGLGIYILRGFELRQVFSASEEYDECRPNVPNCNLRHQEITPANDSDQPALVVTSYEKREAADSEYHRNTWWIGPPVQRCRAYTWNPQRAQFLENTTATAFYCSVPANKAAPRPAR